MEVSVIITCHNYGRYLERAIRSVIDQNYDQDKYEIIVVNDASSDETEKIMANYSERIITINNHKNLGISAARNKGIIKSRGRYIVNLDADDYFHSNILFVQTLFMNSNHEFGAVSCDYFIVDNMENHIVKKSAEREPIACGIMFRKDLLIKIGLYDEDIKIWEEKEMRKRFEKDYLIHNIKIPLYRYRKHGNNHTEPNKL